MLKEDLHSAHLVARIEVIRVDTVGGSMARQEEHAHLRVDTVYKGGLRQGVTTVVARYPINVVGAYLPGFEVGKRAFVCLEDTWEDGATLWANGTATFHIDPDDTVQSPPGSMKFSSEFDHARTERGFANLVVRLMRNAGYVEYVPILATTADSITIKSWINLSGGATLDNVGIEYNASTGTIDFSLLYTPCTGICPTLIYYVDTSASLAPLPAGTYTAYRTAVDSRINAPFVPPDDSVTFTVYTPLSSSAPEKTTEQRALLSGEANGDGGPARVFDIRGRALKTSPMSHAAAPKARGIYVDGRTGVYVPCLGSRRDR